MRGGSGIGRRRIAVLAALVATAGAGMTLAQTHPGGHRSLSRPPVSRVDDAAPMPDPSYRGMKRVLILAQYGPGGEVAGGVESDALCAEVVGIARAGAPVPVACARIGDAMLGDSSALIVIVQASVTRDPAGNRLFAVSVRPKFDGGVEPDTRYFGAAPLVVRYAETPVGRAARADALRAALRQILPWRRVGAAGA